MQPLHAFHLCCISGQPYIRIWIELYYKVNEAEGRKCVKTDKEM